jgi:hypothetical protein
VNEDNEGSFDFNLIGRDLCPKIMSYLNPFELLKLLNTSKTFRNDMIWKSLFNEKLHWMPNNKPNLQRRPSHRKK